MTALVGNGGDDCGEYVNSVGMMVMMVMIVVMVVMRMVEMSTVWAMMALDGDLPPSAHSRLQPPHT